MIRTDLGNTSNRTCRSCEPQLASVKDKGAYLQRIGIGRVTAWAGLKTWLRASAIVSLACAIEGPEKIQAEFRGIRTEEVRKGWFGVVWGGGDGALLLSNIELKLP